MEKGQVEASALQVLGGTMITEAPAYHRPLIEAHAPKPLLAAEDIDLAQQGAEAAFFDYRAQTELPDAFHRGPLSLGSQVPWIPVAAFQGSHLEDGGPREDGDPNTVAIFGRDSHAQALERKREYLQNTLQRREERLATQQRPLPS